MTTTPGQAHERIELRSVRGRKMLSWFMFGLAMLSVPLAISILMGDAPPPKDGPNPGLAMIVVALSFVGFGFFFRYLGRKQIHVVAIHERGLLLSGPTSETFHPWKAITKVTNMMGHAAIYVGDAPVLGLMAATEGPDVLDRVANAVAKRAKLRWQGLGVAVRGAGEHEDDDDDDGAA